MSRKYKAFVSYSWADKKWAGWLHRALELYRTPRDLVGKETTLGPAPQHLHPIFKDREEEAAGHGIGAAIEAAMAASDFLIVVCSPNSAKSKWVNHEVAWFKQHRDKTRILALVVDGEPGAAFMPGREHEECFPKTLLYEVDENLDVTDTLEDVPLAADARKDADGKRGAKLKLAAAMLGVGLDALVKRDDRRRAFRRRVVTTAAFTLAAVMTGLTWVAVDQRDEARAQRLVAQQQSATATATLDYMVSLFEIANPQTENPKTITALTILERGRNKIDDELGDKPMVRARLLNAIGGVYYNLGDLKEASPVLADAANGPFASLEDQIRAKLDYANALTRLGELPQSKSLLDDLEARLVSANAPVGADPARALLDSDFHEQRAIWFYNKQDFGAAITHYQTSLALCRSAPACPANREGMRLTAVGLVLSEQGKAAEGRAMLSQAREVFFNEFGEAHLRTAVAEHNLAYADFKAENFAAAAEGMRHAISVYQRLLEDNHPYQATARQLLGRAYLGMNRMGDAVSTLQDSLSRFETTLGTDHNQVAIVGTYLALAHAGEGGTGEAMALLDRAENIYRLTYPDGDPNLGDVEAHRGLVLAQAGDREKAAEACSAGLAIMAAKLTATDPWLMEIDRQCTEALARIAAVGPGEGG